jgi:hypothetical protein
MTATAARSEFNLQGVVNSLPIEARVRTRT